MLPRHGYSIESKYLTALDHSISFGLVMGDEVVSFADRCAEVDVIVVVLQPPRVEAYALVFAGAELARDIKCGRFFAAAWRRSHALMVASSRPRLQDFASAPHYVFTQPGPVEEGQLWRLDDRHYVPVGHDYANVIAPRGTAW